MFNSSAEFGQFLQQLIDRHQQDLSIILNRLGVERPLEPKTLLLAYQKFGDDFIKELSALPEKSFLGMDASGWTEIFESGRNAVTGKTTETTTQPEEEKKKKPSFWTPKRVVITGIVVVTILAIVLVIIKKSKT